jgi:CDP-glycerol glycerophosphotransferase (TagB/SpsB family)
MIKGLSSRSNFIEMADFMLDVAKQYSDRIQIAFKPHPRLLTELYNHPKWGVEKADSYYKKWADLTNGQLEMGDFVSLFYYSDAMIHDSGSFVIDYIYFNKPQLFITKDVNVQLRESDRIAERVFQNVSTGYNENEIIDFIDNVVIRGNDTKSMIRKQILEEELLPPNGKFASENMYSDICASLGIDG